MHNTVWVSIDSYYNSQFCKVDVQFHCNRLMSAWNIGWHCWWVMVKSQRLDKKVVFVTQICMETRLVEAKT